MYAKNALNANIKKMPNDYSNDATIVFFYNVDVAAADFLRTIYYVHTYYVTCLGTPAHRVESMYGGSSIGLQSLGDPGTPGIQGLLGLQDSGIECNKCSGNPWQELRTCFTGLQRQKVIWTPKQNLSLKSRTKLIMIHYPGNPENFLDTGIPMQKFQKKRIGFQ